MTRQALHPMAQQLMEAFSHLTGLTAPDNTPRRYLWTDAFAVCNFLGLYCQTGDKKYKQLALQLTDQVHNILGRHRHDASRTGWISGLEEEAGKKHPTIRGLRIGKRFNEQAPDEPFDEQLEWERDGQYYHYLTKWMHALHRLSEVTADTTYNRWAIELAKTVHNRFVYTPSFNSQKCIYWKMSIDLSRPLVPSMGHHDPLDGFITYSELRMSVADHQEEIKAYDLAPEISELATICQGKNWVTEDSLGIGGLLCHAYQVANLIANKQFEQPGLLGTILESALLGLAYYTQENTLNLPAENRLAFRELGLSIGLHAVKRLDEMLEEKAHSFENRSTLQPLIEELIQYSPLIELIESFWLDRGNQESDSWLEHRDINMVMLATSLSPEGFLGAD